MITDFTGRNIQTHCITMRNNRQIETAVPDLIESGSTSDTPGPKRILFQKRSKGDRGMHCKILGRR